MGWANKFLQSLQSESKKSSGSGDTVQNKTKLISLSNFISSSSTTRTMASYVEWLLACHCRRRCQGWLGDFYPLPLLWVRQTPPVRKNNSKGQRPLGGRYTSENRLGVVKPRNVLQQRLWSFSVRPTASAYAKLRPPLYHCRASLGSKFYGARFLQLGLFVLHFFFSFFSFQRLCSSLGKRWSFFLTDSLENELAGWLAGWREEEEEEGKWCWSMFGHAADPLYTKPEIDFSRDVLTSWTLCTSWLNIFLFRGSQGLIKRTIGRSLAATC